MNYNEAVQYVESLAPLGSRPGLDNVYKLMDRLGNPQDDLKFVHVAGTNGKGSVCAMMNSIFTEAKIKTGVYTSPSVFSYLEKYKIGRKNVTKDEFAHAMTIVAEAADSMEEHPTPFEVETAAAFILFKNAGCDLVILECGMGGDLDATNVINTTILSVITSISMDHMSFLGKNIAEIAAHKAGIMRPGTAVVSAWQEEEAEEVLKGAADRLASNIEFMPDVYDKQIRIEKSDINGSSFSVNVCDREYTNLNISIPGIIQTANAALAIRAAQLVGICDEKIIRRGLKKCVHPGRLEVIGNKPLVVIDGAHNPDAAMRLKSSVDRYFKGRRMILIMGVFKDKDYDTLARIMTPGAAHVITVQTRNNPRALDSGLLSQCVLNYNSNVTSVVSVSEALEIALMLAGKNDVILAFGSLSYLSEVKAAMKVLTKN